MDSSETIWGIPMNLCALNPSSLEPLAREGISPSYSKVCWPVFNPFEWFHLSSFLISIFPQHRPLTSLITTIPMHVCVLSHSSHAWLFAIPRTVPRHCSREFSDINLKGFWSGKKQRENFRYWSKGKHVWALCF